MLQRHWAEVALSLVGMMVGAGINDLVKKSVAVAGEWPVVPILMGGAYVALAATTMVRLSLIHPTANDLVTVIGAACGSAKGTFLALLTAMAYTAAGYWVTCSSVKDLVTAEEHAAPCALAGVVAICLLLARAPGLVQQFCFATSGLELVRFGTLIALGFYFLRPAADDNAPNYDDFASPATTTATTTATSDRDDAPTAITTGAATSTTETLTSAFLVCVSTFGGFEAAIQHAGARPRAELAKIVYTAVAATLVMYAGVAQASVHALGVQHVLSTPATEIIPAMIDALLAALWSHPWVWVSRALRVVTFLTVVNGAAGALTFAASIIKSAAEANKIRGAHWLRQQQPHDQRCSSFDRSPLVVMAIVVLLYLSSSGKSVASLCGTLLVAVHLICAVALFRAQPGWVDRLLAGAAFAAACFVLLNVFFEVFDAGVVGFVVVVATFAAVRWQNNAEAPLPQEHLHAE